jgi:hypothetical protein
MLKVQCVALDDGRTCDGAAVVFDRRRGGHVCAAHVPRQLVARAVRQLLAGRPGFDLRGKERAAALRRLLELLREQPDVPAELLRAAEARLK